MKTIVACFLGLIALVTLAGGSPVYADVLEAESLASSIAPDAAANGVGSFDDGHCAFYSDGADNCIVNVQPEVNMLAEAVDQSSTAVSEPDPSATESALAIRFMDAIRVTVVQTVTIAASGADAGDREGTSSAQPNPIPATEPVVDHNAPITTGAIVEPAAQSADAIEVAIVQSARVVVPGQGAGGEPPPAELRPPPIPPRSILEAENDGHDNLQ